ncbi:MAG: peptide deformylase [Iamia sp.]
MGRRRDKGGATQEIEHAGRVTHSECPVRRGDRPCEPLNRITRWSVDGGRVTDLCTCSCGRRFPTSHADAAEHLVDPLDPGAAVEVAPGASEEWSIDEVRSFEAEDPRAAKGVVPVETEVLHRPTGPVGRVTGDVKALAKHMVKVMHRAPGVGLAANQVGAPLCLFVQVHKRALPETLVDPEVRASSGTWRYTEGCLSLQVEEVEARLERPRRLQVRARTLHGDVVEATLDEVVARICQHEIDHLDGIEYVQRLTGEAADRVYAAMVTDGIDTSWLPLTPY